MLDAVCDDLEASQRDHFILHKEAYGEGHILPKHLCGRNGVGTIRKDRGNLDMFVVERLNLRVKRTSDHICNTRCLERSLLSSVTTKHSNDLSGCVALQSGLIGKRMPLTLQGRQMQVAGGVRGSGRQIYAGDIVFHGNQVGLVVGCAFEGQELYLNVKILEPDGPAWPNNATYRLTLAKALFRLDLVCEATAWYTRDETYYVVLR